MKVQNKINNVTDNGNQSGIVTIHQEIVINENILRTNNIKKIIKKILEPM